MCSNTGEFGIDLGRMSPPLPYTISIDVSHLSASASLILRLTGESADTTKEVFTLQTDGYGSARAIWCAVPCKGAGVLLGGWGAAPTARHTLTFAVDSSAVTIALDQHQLGKAKQGASLAPIYLDFTLLSGNFTGTAPTGSVDLANFRVT